MNYAALRDSFKSKMNRDDITDVAANTYIQNAIARTQRLLRHSGLEKVAEYVIGDDYDGLDVPNDFIEPKMMYTDSGEVKKKDFSVLLRMPKIIGSPSVYARVAAKFHLRALPASGSTIYFIYYGEDTPLTNDGDESVLSLVAPDIILAGACADACEDFIDDRKEMFEQKFVSRVEEVNLQARLEDLSGELVMEPAHSFGDDY